MSDSNGTAKKFALSLLAAALFGGIALGTTYSVFTSSKSVNTHIEIAGKDSLKASLYLKELKQDVLANDGTILIDQDMMSTIKDVSGESIVPDKRGYVDLSLYSGSIFSTVKLVPTMQGSATFVLVNTGDLAFDYVIEDTRKAYKADGSEDKNAKILDQVVFHSSLPETTSLKKGESEEITLSYVFNDLNENNDVMGESISIDLTFKISGVKSTRGN